MKRWVAVVLVSLVFVSGVVVGWFGARFRMFGQLGVAPPASREVRERLRDELDLTPEQAERIAHIVREGHDEARALRESLRPRVRAVMESNARRIDEVLTPSQREKFAALRRDHRGRMDSLLLGRGEEQQGRRGRGPRRSPPPSEAGAPPEEPGPPPPR